MKKFLDEFPKFVDVEIEVFENSSLVVNFN